MAGEVVAFGKPAVAETFALEKFDLVGPLAQCWAEQLAVVVSLSAHLDVVATDVQIPEEADSSYSAVDEADLIQAVEDQFARDLEVNAVHLRDCVEMAAAELAEYVCEFGFVLHS